MRNHKLQGASPNRRGTLWQKAVYRSPPMSAGGLELVGSSLFRFDLVPMLGSLYEFWDSFGLGSVKNRNLMPQGRPRDAKRTTNRAQIGTQKKFRPVGGQRIRIWSARGGQVKPRGPTLEPKVGLQTPQGLQKGAQKRVHQEPFSHGFCHMF